MPFLGHIEIAVLVASQEVVFTTILLFLASVWVLLERYGFFFPWLARTFRPLNCAFVASLPC